MTCRAQPEEGESHPATKRAFSGGVRAGLGDRITNALARMESLTYDGEATRR